MNNTGKIIAPGTIRFERLLPGPIETVWSYLTESEKRGQWLAKGDMDLVTGGKVTLEFLHSELSNIIEPVPEKFKNMENGHIMTGEIVSIDPPRLLSFTWDNQSSEVEFRLSEQGDKILLVLTHSKLGDNRDAIVSTSGGWYTHLTILQDRLQGKEPAGFWGIYMNVEQHLERTIRL